MSLPIIFLIILLLETTMIQPSTQALSTTNSQTSKQTIYQTISSTTHVFSHRPHGHLYWHALLHVANNNKEIAKAIVAAIQANTPETVTDILTNNNQHALDAYFDEIFVTFVARNPQVLSELGLFESIGISEHNAFLNDVSPQSMVQNLEDLKTGLQKLEHDTWGDLSPEQKNSLNVLRWLQKHTLAGEDFLFHDYKVSQMGGILFDLTSVFTQFQTLKTIEDVELYIARLREIPEHMNQTIALLEHQKNLGITIPALAIEKVINIIQSLLPATITDNLFYTHLAGRLDSINIVNKELLDVAQQAVQTHVHPAFQRLLDYFKTLQPQVTTNHGVWALPNGDAFYEHLLERHTTTRLTADQIHELGLQEVASIQNQMRAILATENIVDAQKPVGTLVQEVAQNPDFYFPDTQEGREQCLAEFNAILDRCRKELYPLFDLKPNSPVKIVPVPKHEEEGMPGAYYIGPSLDGSRPGIFFANLRSMKEVPTYGMETLTIHEAEPGHHFQIALQVESKLPVVRRVSRPDEFNAYVEGWALYVEKLAYEQDFYSSSFAKLGHLRDELLRAVRLVVDTGIHKKRWTREQAIDYMHDATGFDKNSVVTEIERYFVLPGQACSYKIGQLKILELRARAKNALGQKFDIREFHNVVLNLGSAPLTVLEEVVDQYICDKQA